MSAVWSISGDDEIATARSLAAGWRYAAASGDVTVMGVGTGGAWPALAAEQGRVLLLTTSDGLADPSATWLHSIRSGLRVVVAGDGGSVNQDVSVALAAAVN